MKKILIIGGTKFVGRVIVETLLEQGGFDIHLYNRGKTNKDLFPKLKTFIGDRHTDNFQEIARHDWDVVIDTSCYLPLPFRRLLDVLKGKVGRYILISTVSVYDTRKNKGQIINEETTLLPCNILQMEKANIMADYGELKAECERILLTYYDIDSIILRPSLIYGKYEPFLRMYYWMYRIKTQNKMIVPDGGRFLDAYTFVDDLAKIVLKASTIKKHKTVYNTNTHPPKSLYEMLQVMCKVIGNTPEFVNIPTETLKKEGLGIWNDIPLWLPWHSLLGNNKIIRDFDMDFDDFESSIQKTVAYREQQGWPDTFRGISLEREREVMEKCFK